MTKAEFLATLRSKLMGEVSVTELENTIRYYDEYITDGLKQGKSEATILQELGSPLLIARTIIDTAGNGAEGQGMGQPKYTGERNSGEKNPYAHHYEISPVMSKVIVVLVILVALFLVFTILRVLIPILIPLLVIWFIVTMFRSGRR